MSELNKIQPAQRIIPTREDQHLNEKKKQQQQKEKQGRARQSEQQHKREGKVDEYI